jgi:hypothetical protein
MRNGSSIVDKCLVTPTWEQSKTSRQARVAIYPMSLSLPVEINDNRSKFDFFPSTSREETAVEKMRPIDPTTFFSTNCSRKGPDA